MMCPSVFIVVADNQLLNMRYLLENELAEIFTLDAMDNIKTMFDFEKRRRIVEKLSEKKTDKNAADLIIKIVSQNGD